MTSIKKTMLRIVVYIEAVHLLRFLLIYYYINDLKIGNFNGAESWTMHTAMEKKDVDM